ncbi:hypothetical protein PR048_027663 [Dryococelus australis]|uniref:Uncharacterized protein n=1 Tax=Dryococelus australis TaxID=614101 RepID=A0ABQ9GH56_9NEOP|nr:hypothetical protein PR048_027663 [Dryococelus australis]
MLLSEAACCGGGVVIGGHTDWQRVGHVAKSCQTTCVVCGAKHIPLMSPNLGMVKPESHEKTLQDNEEKVLANHLFSDTLLQALIVRIEEKTGDRYIIILIDTGSRCSYITKEFVSKMGYQSVGKEKLRHDDSSPVEVLAGADVADKLLTGERIILEDGLVAANTYLGWRLMEKVPDYESCSQTIIVSTLFSSQMSLFALWELDLSETVCKKEQLEEYLPLPTNYETQQGIVLENPTQKFALPDVQKFLKNTRDKGTRHNKGGTSVRCYFTVPHGPSLNDCSEEGPNLMAATLSLLLRFRLKPVGKNPFSCTQNLRSNLFYRSCDVDYKVIDSTAVEGQCKLGCTSTRSAEESFRGMGEVSPFIEKTAIPRYITKECAKGSLHTFCDASQHAYAAVVFLRSKSPSSIEDNLIEARARVAPTKKTTIPLLELRHEKTLGGVFVHNRVQEIRRLSDNKSWRHVAGTKNRADTASRGFQLKCCFGQNGGRGQSGTGKAPSE